MGKFPPNESVVTTEMWTAVTSVERGIITTTRQRTSHHSDNTIFNGTDSHQISSNICKTPDPSLRDSRGMNKLGIHKGIFTCVNCFPSKQQKE